MSGGINMGGPTDDLLALAERCEQATGPDRELDREIAMATGWSHRSGAVWERVLEWERPAFTASLDAAMSLAPEGVRTLINIAEDAITTAIVEGTQGCADTPELALCAAALRARAESSK